MNKMEMRIWVASLEDNIEQRLHKWKKENRFENGETVELRWTFDRTHFHIIIFWEDKKETVNLKYLSPRIDHSFLWHGLNDETVNNIMDRVGNLAQVTMYPPKSHNGRDG